MKKASPYIIAIDARPLAEAHVGTSMYLGSIITTLLNAQFTVQLFTNRPLHKQYEYVNKCTVEQFGPKSDWSWEQRALPDRLRQAAPDLYLGVNRAIPWSKVGRTRYILALLDIIPFKFPRDYIFSYPFHFARRELIPQLISIIRANALTTISVKSASDIKQLFRRNVTPLLIRLPEVKIPKPSKPKDQFVYVGGVNPRKRIDVLLHAFQQFQSKHAEYRLILIGHGYEAYAPLIHELGLNNHVVLTGFVPEEEKNRLIGESRAMVYPSLYEGYGLAIAEAMQVGTPIISGRGGSQTEIGGKAVRYIDPTDTRALVEAMVDMLDDKKTSALLDKAPAQLQKLTSPDIEVATVNFFVEQAELSRKHI